LRRVAWPSITGDGSAPATRPAGTSGAQLDLHALEHLEASGALTPRELQQRLGLTSGAITALIDRLERVGWVARTPNPDDRRSVLVELSEMAHDAARQSVGDYHRDVRRIIERHSAADRATIQRFLERVTEAARRHGDRFWDEAGPADGRDGPPPAGAAARSRRGVSAPARPPRARAGTVPPRGARRR
jgi:DNA-binding MarR family transcriptional regulator